MNENEQTEKRKKTGNAYFYNTCVNKKCRLKEVCVGEEQPEYFLT